jgi:hypothetical protein
MMKLRLRQLIRLTVISKQINCILLLEENWYIVMDTKRMLYNFIRRIFKVSSVKCPKHTITEIIVPTDVFRRI